MNRNVTLVRTFAFVVLAAFFLISVNAANAGWNENIDAGDARDAREGGIAFKLNLSEFQDFSEEQVRNCASEEFRMNPSMGQHLLKQQVTKCLNEKYNPVKVQEEIRSQDLMKAEQNKNEVNKIREKYSIKKAELNKKMEAKKKRLDDKFNRSIQDLENENRKVEILLEKENQSELDTLEKEEMAEIYLNAFANRTNETMVDEPSNVGAGNQTARNETVADKNSSDHINKTVESTNITAVTNQNVSTNITIKKNNSTNISDTRSAENTTNEISGNVSVDVTDIEVNRTVNNVTANVNETGNISKEVSDQKVANENRTNETMVDEPSNVGAENQTARNNAVENEDRNVSSQGNIAFKGEGVEVSSYYAYKFNRPRSLPTIRIGYVISNQGIVNIKGGSSFM